MEISIEAFAKVNIYLKIVGYRDGYHLIESRFMRVNSLFDTISFVPAKCDTFTIEGCKDIPRESNTIFKAYKALNEATGNLDILEFFYNHKVVVKKRIPSGAGLGGGSSDAGAFLRLVNSVCNLNLSKEYLANIGSKVGADVSFFVYDYDVANVSGFGEVVEPFNEEALNLEIFTPDVSCNTAKVYSDFHKNFLNKIEPNSYLKYKDTPSKEILMGAKNKSELNDLYLSALNCCPKLREYKLDGWFFSGSGSSYFKLA